MLSADSRFGRGFNSRRLHHFSSNLYLQTDPELALWARTCPSHVTPPKCHSFPADELGKFDPVLGLLFLVATSLAPPSNNAAPAVDTTKGASLLRGCQAEMRLMGVSSLEEAPQMDLINGAYCIGYLNGFTAALPPTSTLICTHQKSMGSMVRAYVTYMEQNPALGDEDKRVGLRLALQNAFPCSASR